MTCVTSTNGDDFILIVHQALFYNDKDQDESLCLPFQAEQHGVTFSLTPNNCTDSNGVMGKQNMIIEHKNVPLHFNGRKLYLNIRYPSDQDIQTLESYELTSPKKDPTPTSYSQHRQSTKDQNEKYPGGLTMSEWRKQLALALPDVIRKTFYATSQLGMNVEINDQAVGRRHFKTRFPFLKQKRLNDTFHSDTFFPSVKSTSGNTCSQMFFGERSDFMYVQPLKQESNAITALQDFSRKVGLPEEIINWQCQDRDW